MIKSFYEIIKIRSACRTACAILDQVEKYISSGTCLSDLDEVCATFIRASGCASAVLKYKTNGHPTPFQKSVCVSSTDIICHGTPHDYVLMPQDHLNVDLTIIKDGYHGDLSRMYTPGAPNPKVCDLIKTCYECLWLSAERIKPGISINMIGLIIQNHARAHGFHVVEEYCGHGIGRGFHEPPLVPHNFEPSGTLLLQEGMVFTIEPILSISPHHLYSSDCWTVRSYDTEPTAQWEHTVLVTSEGNEILTA